MFCSRDEEEESGRTSRTSLKTKEDAGDYHSRTATPANTPLDTVLETIQQESRGEDEKSINGKNGAGDSTENTIMNNNNNPDMKMEEIVNILGDANVKEEIKTEEEPPEETGPPAWEQV